MSTDQRFNSTDDHTEPGRLRRDAADRDAYGTSARDVRNGQLGRNTQPIAAPALEDATRAAQLADTEPVEPRAQTEQAEVEASGGRVTPPERGAEMAARWQSIQAEFVDDPRKAVTNANQLVKETVERIVTAFTRGRDELEARWSSDRQVSTEDLRVCLQRYREFFSRLAPIIDGLHDA